jgi:hypothetical protein
MPAPDEKNATVVVIEKAPGWIYVKIADPRPEPERIELLLGLTIQHWFNAHPQFVIDKKLDLTENGALEGINVWYHAEDRQPEPANPEPARQALDRAKRHDHDPVRERFPAEYIEAVVQEAMQFSASQQNDRGTMVVIMPRGIAVIIDQEVKRGAVVLVDVIYPRIDVAARATLQTWLARPTTRLHVLHVPGSWFFPYDDGSPSRLADPDITPTNMTYDTGPRPEP